MEEIEPIDVELVKDKILVPHLLDEVLKILNQSEEASYRLWLILGKKYGAMQLVV